SLPDRSYQAFLAELGKLGFSEGKNLIIEYQRVDDARGPFVVAAEMMRLPLDLIIAGGPEVALQAAISASRTIPILFEAINFDPIDRGYVSGLAQPGGNITGVFYRQLEITAKQVELLTHAFPDRTRLGVVWDVVSADQFGAAESTARSMHLDLRPLKLENPPYNFDAALATLAQNGAQMVLILSSPFFSEFRPEIAVAALRHRLPTMFIFRSYVDAGGLMSYGADRVAALRLLASYVAKILTGTKPTDLPVERVKKFELVVNLKTARALGIEIAPAILIRADEVIE